MKVKTTAQLIVGDAVRLVDFGATPNSYRRSLLALGLTLGAQIRVIQIAPLGCPIQIEVLGSAIALRKSEAQHMLWE